MTPEKLNELERLLAELIPILRGGLSMRAAAMAAAARERLADAAIPLLPDLLSAAREAGRLREALERILPANLGELPASMPDSFVFPCDVTAGEIREARAALSTETGDQS